MAQGFQQSGFSSYNSYRVVLAGYALGGLILIALYLRLSKTVEVVPGDRTGQPLFPGIASFQVRGFTTERSIRD